MNRDRGIAAESKFERKRRFFTAASRMKHLFSDESPASNPPPRPLFASSSLVVVIAIDLFEVPK
ncbi:MAG TPA: hypothetical protein ENN79_14780 [Desulfobacteraceae bacterium]|nr:hypothetical protein [Desulfobacteraceae bacterium]